MTFRFFFRKYYKAISGATHTALRPSIGVEAVRHHLYNLWVIYNMGGHGVLGHFNNEFWGLGSSIFGPINRSLPIISKISDTFINYDAIKINKHSI